MKNILLVPTRNSLLSDWLYYIEHLSAVAIDLSLDRVKKIANILGLIHPGSYVILVGGTNGKGTTCCLLESILLSSNISVGLYTSPHLLSYNERVRVCGKELSDDTHIEAMLVIESIRGSIALTYFEFITLSALYIFKQRKLDVIILEVGMGGRLDATNIVDADISVITNIAIDHTDFLGTNRNQIGIEKSGIFRSNKPAVIGDSNYPVTIDKMAKYYNAMLFAKGKDWNYFVYHNNWIWWDCNFFRLFKLPLPKMIPLENAATVLGVLYWFPFSISEVSIYHGLQSAVLPGRFQIISWRPLIILDVGHNPHAANYLVDRLTNMMVFKKNYIRTVRAVVGMLKNKDILGTIHYLSKVVNVWYFATLNTSMSATVSQFTSVFSVPSANVQCFSNILEAWEQAVLDATMFDCVLVFGSFYAVYPIIKKVGNNRF